METLKGLVDTFDCAARDLGAGGGPLLPLVGLVIPPLPFLPTNFPTVGGRSRCDHGRSGEG